MKILRSAAIAVIIICSCLTVYSQNSTSMGTEFWTAYMDHVDPPTSPGGSTMDLYITSNVSTTGTVSVVDGTYSQNFNVTANQVTILTMPASAFLGSQGLFNKGIHILAAKPIAIYAHIFAENSSGATLLLPVNTLGKDYYSINYRQESNQVAYSAFMVIATQDSTTVEITPIVSLIGGQLPGEPYDIHLNKGQVYQGLANDDLTGTRIRSISSGANSCTKIAVFSGSSKIAIDCNATDNSSDNLYQQVYPTASWGKNYITVPLKNRNYDIFRIVLSTPATNVQLNGTAIAQDKFTNGFYYEFNSQTPNIITADQPVQVVQYAVSQGNTLECGNDGSDIGDPEMIYLTPLEQTLSQVTLFSTSNYLILQSYINVLIKTAAAPSFIIDGEAYNGFAPVPGDTSYSFAQINVAKGTHNIGAGDGFNAIAYGFGQHESYGYAAGANLQNLNTFLALENPLTNSVQSNGCTSVSYDLGLTIPYKTTKITWDFTDGTPEYVDNNPKADSALKGTQEVYMYSYPKNPVGYKKGSYTATATVFDPGTDVCGSTETIELDYNITDPPVTKFSVSDECLGDPTLFTDQTTDSTTIKSWLWTFGDGQTSTLQNPQHAYATSGTYTVSLTVADVDSCSTVAFSNVEIDAKPVASFAISSPDCIGQTITFTDQSTSANAAIATRIWDFGDGTTDTVTSKMPTTVTHTYANTGIDTVKLYVVTTGGCASPVFLQVETINPLPVVNFTLPDVCLTDTYAQFNDESTIADGSTSAFTYLWNFGDPNASALNPNTSTLKNPTHKYTAAANYNVSLTVQSKYGCQASGTQQFTVNGTNPVAGFAVENSGDLCSSDSVVFDDQSSVDFGYITRIVWYFDYNNNPTDSVAYERSAMPADRKYRYYYGLFNTAQTKNYAVKMVAYSGQTCVNEYGPVTITIKPNPVVTLSQLGYLCQDASPVQIVENKNGYTGTGVFSGPGVSSTGLFSPAITGLGTFTINYVFTAQNGCDYSTSEQVNVITAPIVSTDSVITVLEGDPVTLKATALGNNLTYNWSPSTALSNSTILNPVASPADDIKYTLTVTSDNGCSTTVGINVKVLKKIIVPNAFTPNGDGINDTWDIKYLENYPGCTVDIFNRYGEKLYSSVGYAVPWDGTYKGANLPTGTYYYIINPKNGRSTVSGFVTIIR